MRKILVGVAAGALVLVGAGAADAAPSSRFAGAHARSCVVLVHHLHVSLWGEPLDVVSVRCK